MTIMQLLLARPGPHRMHSHAGMATALGGKAIETLTPEEARRQPTPTDAAGVSNVDREVAGAVGNLRQCQAGRAPAGAVVKQAADAQGLAGRALRNSFAPGSAPR